MNFGLILEEQPCLFGILARYSSRSSLFGYLFEQKGFVRQFDLTDQILFGCLLGNKEDPRQLARPINKFVRQLDIADQVFSASSATVFICSALAPCRSSSSGTRQLLPINNLSRQLHIAEQHFLGNIPCSANLLRLHPATDPLSSETPELLPDQHLISSAQRGLRPTFPEQSQPAINFFPSKPRQLDPIPL